VVVGGIPNYESTVINTKHWNPLCMSSQGFWKISRHCSWTYQV